MSDDSELTKHTDAELVTNDFVIETKSIDQLTEKDFADICKFVEKEREDTDKYARSTEVDADLLQKRRNDVTNHSVYILGFIDGIRKGIVKTGYITLAKNISGQIVGTGTINLDMVAQDPERVKMLYFGRSWNNPKQGISTNILKAQHLTLTGLGIHSYFTFIGSESEKAYKRLGVNYRREISLQPNHITVQI